MKKTHKCLLYIVIGIILQTAIILIFVLTFMRARTPKLRFRSVSVQTLTTNSSASSPSFTMKLNTQITVKNTNFGKFKFSDFTATMYYKGIPIGEAAISKGKAKARSTKKVDVGVSLSSKKVTSGNLNLASDLKSGKLRLTSHGTLKGKVHLLKVIRRKKTAEMNCYMDVNTKTKAVENLHCK